MAEVTAPVLLDSTGQDMVTKLEGMRAALAAEVTPATTATAGIVKPDGTTILVDANGTISSASTVAPATTAAAGIVKPDGTSISVDANGGIATAPATTAHLGGVKPDGSSITVNSSGVISTSKAAIGAAGAPSYVQYTISASGWASNVYSFESLYPSSTYDIWGITTNDSTTADQRTAWIAADCGGYRATNTIYAHGTVPTIDIIVTLVVVAK